MPEFQLIDGGRKMNLAGPGVMSSNSPRAGRGDDDDRPKMRSHSASSTLSVRGCSTKAISNYNHGVRSLTPGRSVFISGEACLHSSKMDQDLNVLSSIVSRLSVEEHVSI